MKTVWNAVMARTVVLAEVMRVAFLLEPKPLELRNTVSARRPKARLQRSKYSIWIWRDDSTLLIRGPDPATGENAPPALFPIRDPRGLQDHLSIQRQDFQTRREYSSAMRQVKEAGAHRVAPPRSLLASYQKGVWAITPDTFSIKVSFAHGSEFVVEWKVGVLRRPLVEVLIGALFVDATRNQVGSP